MSAQSTRTPAQFRTELVLRELPDGDHFALEYPLVYTAKDETLYTVPAGFVTDFASVPRILWNILPPYGKHSRAAVLHDWLYVTGIVDRDRADGLFLEAMTALGVGWITRRMMHRGVRVGGWLPWRRYRAQAAEAITDPGVSGR